ncbi:unnamed protein product, partial [Rotaria magnacalcarata]
MQQGTTPPIQTHYPSHYHQYPVAPTLSASSSSSL